MSGNTEHAHGRIDVKVLRNGAKAALVHCPGELARATLAVRSGFDDGVVEEKSLHAAH